MSVHLITAEASGRLVSNRIVGLIHSRNVSPFRWLLLVRSPGSSPHRGTRCSWESTSGTRLVIPYSLAPPVPWLVQTASTVYVVTAPLRPARTARLRVARWLSHRLRWAGWER